LLLNVVRNFVLPLLYCREAESTPDLHPGWEDKGICCSVCDVLSCYFSSTGESLSLLQDHTESGRTGDPAAQCVTYSRATCPLLA
jgi:hypothetical protein